MKWKDGDLKYTSDGRRVCTTLPPPEGSGVETCAILGGVDPGAGVSLIVKGSDLPEGARAGTSYFVGVGMRLGQTASEQEHVLRVRKSAVVVVQVVVAAAAVALGVVAAGCVDDVFVGAGVVVVFLVSGMPIFFMFQLGAIGLFCWSSALLLLLASLASVMRQNLVVRLRRSIPSLQPSRGSAGWCAT